MIADYILLTIMFTVTSNFQSKKTNQTNKQKQAEVQMQIVPFTQCILIDHIP